MTINLCTLPGVTSSDEIAHPLRGLERGGKRPVVSKFTEWRQSNIKEFKKIWKTVQLVGVSHRVHDEDKVERDHKLRNGRKSPIFEIKAKDCMLRLFFFYYRVDGHEFIVLTHGWEKGNNQDAQFALAYSCYLQFKTQQDTI